jgi:hypothetical protein
MDYDIIKTVISYHKDYDIIDLDYDIIKIMISLKL